MKFTFKNAGCPIKRLFIFVVPAVLTLLSGCGSGESQPKKVQPAETNQVIAAVHADVVEVRRADVSVPLAITGTIQAGQEANVGTKVAGKIERIAVDEGAAVQRRDLLFRIDQSDLVLAEKAARAGLAMVGASLRDAVLTLENAAREKDRLSRLYEKRVISQQKYEDIVMAHALASNRVELAKARLTEAEANLALAMQRLQDSVITAPFSGVVVKKFLNEAEIVAAGMPVIAIMNIDRVKAEVEIPETRLNAVMRGTPVEVTLDALPKEVFRGAISRLNARVNPLSRAFKAEIDIKNPGQRIKPGMFARITILNDMIRNVIVLPTRALVTDGRGNAAVLVVQNDRVVFRKITPGVAGDSLVEVRGGLAAGEKVVVAGNYGMEENTLIAPQLVPY